jgi:hypothetical protein
MVSEIIRRKREREKKRGEGTHIYRKRCVEGERRPWETVTDIRKYTRTIIKYQVITWS